MEKPGRGGGVGRRVLDREEWKAETTHYEKLKVKPSGLDHSTVTEIVSVLTLVLAAFW